MKVARWLVPDFALFFSLVVVLVLLGPLQGTRTLFSDADAGWHIRTGERIIRGSFPRQDPYSFSRPDETWYAWEWGADAVVGVAHKTGGLSAVVFVYSLVIALTVWLWFKLCLWCGGDLLLTVAFLPALVGATFIHLLARPHLFSWALLLVTLMCVKHAPETLRLWHVVSATAFAALWTSLHASFFLAILICLLYAACNVVRRFLWDTDSTADLARARWLGTMAICLALGSFVNPYGWNLHRHLGAYLSDQEMLSKIQEFQTYDFNSDGGWVMVSVLALGALGSVLALGGRQLADSLLLAGLAATAIRSGRMLPIYAVLGLPLAAGAITSGSRRWSDLRESAKGKLNFFFAYSREIRVLDSRCGGGAIAVVVPFVLWYGLQAGPMSARTGFPGTKFPLRVAERVAFLPPSARIVAPDWIGGYLIYRYDATRKVYFDGRSDFYGARFVSEYETMANVRPGWDGIVERYGFTHALLPNGSPLLAALERQGWRPLDRDEIATLLER